MNSARAPAREDGMHGMAAGHKCTKSRAWFPWPSSIGGARRTLLVFLSFLILATVANAESCWFKIRPNDNFGQDWKASPEEATLNYCDVTGYSNCAWHVAPLGQNYGCWPEIGTPGGSNAWGIYNALCGYKAGTLFDLGQLAIGKKCDVEIFRGTSKSRSCSKDPGFGHPIHPLSGSKTKSVDLGVTIGGIPLTLTYDTGRQLTAMSSGKQAKNFGDLPSFGPLWFSSLHRKLLINVTATDLKVLHGDGTLSGYWPSGSTFVADTGDTYDTLTSVNGGFRFWQAQTGTLENFNSAGQLTDLADRSGNSLVYFYSTGSSSTVPAAGYLVGVTDNTGRSIRFEYTLPVGGIPTTDGLISKVIGPNGEIAFAYDGRGNLTTLTWPDAKVHQFLYENPTYPWALTGEIDENSSRYSTYSYDADGLAIATELAGGVEKYLATYGGPPRQVTVATVFNASNGTNFIYYDVLPPSEPVLTGPSGSSMALTSISVNGQPVLAGQSKAAGSGCAASSNALAFDVNGNIASRDDFQGIRTCYAYDISGRETARVEGLANTTSCTSVTPSGVTLPAGSRKTLTTWHTDWSLPVQVIQPLRVTTTVYHGQNDPFNGNVTANCTTAAAMPNGKPLPVVCKQVQQVSVGDATDFASATDSNFNSVRLLMHMDGPNNSTTFTDSSAAPRTVTASGTAKILTAQSKFGGSSVYFDGTASCLSSPAANNWALDAGDFTVELWYNPTVLRSSRLVTSRLTQGGASGTWAFNISGTGISFTEVVAGEPGVSASFGFSAGVWYHLVAQRGAGTLALFVNGVQVASAANSTNFSNQSYPLNIGCSPSESYLNGYMDDLRITRGVSRYAGNFLPPSQPYGSSTISVSNVIAQSMSYGYDSLGHVVASVDPNGRTTNYGYYADTSFSGGPYDPYLDNVSLLLHGNGTNGSTSIVDSGPLTNSVTAVGNAQLSTAQSKFGGGSIAFDGLGDYLSIPYSTAFAFGSGDFTIETFFYKNANNANGIRIWNPDGDVYDGVAGYIDGSGNFGTYISTNGTSWTQSMPAVANLANGQWYHLAITRSGGSVFAFVNGVRSTVTTALGTTPIYSNTSYPRVIGGQGSVNRALNGYIDEFRITKGMARYTDNFTPPAQEFVQTRPSSSATGHTVGDLARITDAAGHVTQFNLYDPAGRVRQMTDPKGVVTDITYTPRGWVSTVSVTPPGAVARTTSYSYDGVGQVTGVTQPDGTSLTYSYDAAHRLVGATDARGNAVSYTLDNLGNRIAEEVRDPTGVLQRSIARSFDALNRLQQVTGAAR